jgi:hypothetical protein
MKRLDVVPEELWTLLLANSMGLFDFGLWPLVAPKNLCGSFFFLLLLRENNNDFNSI